MPCLTTSRCPQLAADAHIAECDTGIGVPSLLLEGFAQSSRSLTRVPLEKCTKGLEGRKPEGEVIIVKVSSVQGMAPLPLALSPSSSLLITFVASDPREFVDLTEEDG